LPNHREDLFPLLTLDEYWIFESRHLLKIGNWICSPSTLAGVFGDETSLPFSRDWRLDRLVARSSASSSASPSMLSVESRPLEFSLADLLGVSPGLPPPSKTPPKQK